MARLANAYFDAKHPEKALPVVGEFLVRQRQRMGANNPGFASVLTQVSLDFLKSRQFLEADKLLRESLAIREKTAPDSWPTFHTQSLLGAALLGQSKYADAEPLLLLGYQGLKAREAKINPKIRDARLQAAMGPLAELFEVTRKKEERNLQGELTDAKREAAHPVKLSAGEAAVILMQSKAFDTYAMVVDEKNKIVARSDDIDYAAKNTNSRIWFMPQADGVYRIVAGSYQKKGRGEYEIIIRQYSPAKAE